jgi:hypothetical protein
MENGGGNIVNSPDASELTCATTRPSSRNSTTTSGPACPAITASPVGSTRTMSKAGRCTAGLFGLRSGAPADASAGGAASFATVEFALGETTAGGACAPGQVIGSLTISALLMVATAAAAIPAPQYLKFFESTASNHLTSSQ